MFYLNGTVALLEVLDQCLFVLMDKLLYLMSNKDLMLDRLRMDLIGLFYKDAIK